MPTERFRIEVPATPRVAVVDDDPSLRNLMVMALSRRGCDPRPFADGAEALAEIERGAFDLVVTDVAMPRLDGIGLTRALRQKFDKRRLPIIVVSVHDEEDVVLRAYEAGASEYLVKPFGPAALTAKVHALLRPPDALDLPAWQEGSVLPARLDRWVLERELGHGAMGVVMAARRISDGEVAALKILRTSLTVDRLALARYFREVASMRAVVSPHLVRFIEAGHAAGRHYLAMELIEGKTLHAVAREGPVPVSIAVRVGRDVCRAIAVLLEHGLVHRDVKPQNIMLRRDGRVVLVDFGLAKRPADALTAFNEVIGTPEFMAPEVIRGDLPDGASELYSVGATLYDLLCGEPPITGGAGHEVLRKVVDGHPIVPIRELRPDVPIDVETLVMSLLRTEARRRPGDPAEVADAFAALCDAPVAG